MIFQMGDDTNWCWEIVDIASNPTQHLWLEIHYLWSGKNPHQRYPPCGPAPLVFAPTAQHPRKEMAPRSSPPILISFSHSNVEEKPGFSAIFWTIWSLPVNLPVEFEEPNKKKDGSIGGSWQVRRRPQDGLCSTCQHSNYYPNRGPPKSSKISRFEWRRNQWSCGSRPPSSTIPHNLLPVLDRKIHVIFPSQKSCSHLHPIPITSQAVIALLWAIKLASKPVESQRPPSPHRTSGCHRKHWLVRFDPARLPKQTWPWKNSVFFIRKDQW